MKLRFYQDFFPLKPPYILYDKAKKNPTAKYFMLFCLSSQIDRTISHTFEFFFYIGYITSSTFHCILGSLQTFSAVCWLYGKFLSQHFNYPIGLVETNWGGTRIEAWSSPDALKRCAGFSGRKG